MGSEALCFLGTFSSIPPSPFPLFPSFSSPSLSARLYLVCSVPGTVAQLLLWGAHHLVLGSELRRPGPKFRNSFLWRALYQALKRGSEERREQGKRTREKRHCDENRKGNVIAVGVGLFQKCFFFFEIVFFGNIKNTFLFSSVVW